MKKSEANFMQFAKEVEDKLFNLLLKKLKTITITEEVYCLNIVYGSEHHFPPFFAFGKSSLKNQWIQENIEGIAYYLWNFAEYDTDEFELDLNTETKELFKHYNQEINKREIWHVAIKAIVRITKKLKDYLHYFKINKSNDFVIIATDLEQIDIAKNFKIINPEKFEEFKKLLF